VVVPSQGFRFISTDNVAVQGEKTILDRLRFECKKITEMIIDLPESGEVQLIPDPMACELVRKVTHDLQ
jgi:hypothetical protein